MTNSYFVISILRLVFFNQVLPLGRDEYERRPHSVAVGVMNTAIKIQGKYVFIQRDFIVCCRDVQISNK